MRGAEPDQVGDLAGVLAQVAAQRQHRLGGPDRFVEAILGHLEPESDLERLGQDLQRRHLGRHDVHATVLDLVEGLPVDRVHPGRPVRPSKGIAAVLGHRLQPQLQERHAPEAVATGDALLAVEERPLLHEALQVLLRGIARIQLTEIRQELILQGRPRRRHRMDVEADRGFAGGRARRPRAQGCRDQQEMEHGRRLPAPGGGLPHFLTVNT